MRGNSERFSSKNPVFDQRKGIVVASVIGIIASFRSYPCGVSCACENETAIRAYAYRSCSQKVKRCDERRQKKKELRERERK